MNRNQDLLPSNALTSERALSLATRFGDDVLPEDIKKLWRPHEAPARFLPFMAWGLHVDFWRDTLSEHAKRDLIAGSFEWHRIEGTFGAIRRICDAAFGKTQVKAWHEYGGEPYGFKVITEGTLSGPGEWEALHEAIWFAQALRDWLDGIEIRRNLKIDYHLGVVLCKRGCKQLGLPPLRPRSTQLYAGCALVRHGGKQIGLPHRERLSSSLTTGTAIVKSGVKKIGLSKVGWEIVKEVPYE